MHYKNNTTTTAPQPKTRRLMAGYALALFLVGLIIAVMHFMIDTSFKQQFADAPVINVAGRQRMLSQQITQETLLLAQSDTPEIREHHRRWLSDTTNEWSTTHKALRVGGEALNYPGENSPEIKELFAEIDPYFKKLQATLDNITALAPAALSELVPDSPPIKEIVKNASLFQKLMELIVSQYEKEARDRIMRHKRFENLTLFLVLIILVMTTVFIFRPMVKRVRHDYKVLQAANRLLENEVEERKRAERELTKYRNRLEEMVEKRSAELKSTNESLMKEIAERKQVEEELRQNEQRFRAIFEKAATGMAMTGLDGRFIYVNKSLCDMLGYTEHGLTNLHFKEITHPDDREDGMEALRSLLSGEKNIYRTEKRYVHKLGHAVWIFLNCVLVRDESGKPVYFTVQMQDITARKHAEDSIRKSEEQLRIITDNLPAFISYVDSDRRYRFANIMFEKHYGIPKVEIPGLHVKDVLGERGYEIVRKNIDTVLSGKAVTWEGELPCYNGEERTRSATYIPHFGDGGKVKGFFVLSFDVTERRKMEQELLKAQKLESIGILAGGIAHDFNNLLHLILGNISLAKITAKKGTTFDRLVEVEKATFRAEKLARQLLTFSMGGTPVKRTADIKKLILETVKFYLSGTNVKCDVMIANDLSHVEIDDGQVNQVLDNIIINAKQAMPDGGVIEVRAENVEVDEKGGLPLNSGRYVKISIQDNGPGIAKEDLQKVFDPFFTSKAEGNGLGLAISYSIVKNHGGLLDVESKNGKGAAFHIYLQASDKTAEAREHKINLISGKGRILIMDDDEAIRNAAENMLDILGYETEVAINGEEALEKFKNAQKRTKPFDLVVLDLTVRGGMGGLETIKKLKQLNPNVKAIVSSSYSMDPVLSDFIKYGFCGCMPKPYEVETISHEVDKALHLV